MSKKLNGSTANKNHDNDNKIAIRIDKINVNLKGLPVSVAHDLIEKLPRELAKALAKSASGRYRNNSITINELDLSKLIVKRNADASEIRSLIIQKLSKSFK
jgi:hypothetical protein